MKANYRKINDRSHNSSTYHKKDGTPVRHRLKQEANKQIQDDQKGADIQNIEVGQKRKP